MVCNSCGNRGICKVKALANEMVTTMIIKVEGCKMFLDMTEDNAAMIQTNEKKIKPSNVESNRIHDIARITETTDKIKELIQKNKSARSDTEEKCSCGNVAVYKCNSCGTPLCEDCATHTIDGRILCASCYDKDDGVKL